MAANLGNQFWKNRSKHGRDKLFATPDLLWQAASDGGYNSPYWMTFKQAKLLGGNIKKGEKAATIFYASSCTLGNNEEEEQKGRSGQKDREYFHWHEHQVPSISLHRLAEEILQLMTQRCSLLDLT